MTQRPVLILGARSDIGLAIAHLFAARGHPVQLAMRNAAAHDAIRADIAIRHAVAVTLHEFDALATDRHSGLVDSLPELPEVVVCVVGLLGDQARDEQDPASAVTVMRTNFEGPASILSVLATRFEERGSGTLVGISSVAGERGRASNYIYGSAKAGFTAFLSGLRNRLAGRNVHVVTVIPGFVRTRMTDGLALPAVFTTDPPDIARLVYRAVTRRKDIVYSRWWFLIMAIIRHIPERLFKRMSL
ncbi:MAG: SDR family oxidoreductase [Candidatus Puniceispirillaceae bacterium]